ncbi:MAG: DUF2537 domain-containing protein [Acidobacteria bacterium]|nr:MAG: DUF2537 domain-containing protein [Acidobacteriota bacterium]
MPAMAFDQLCLREMALSITEEDPGGGLGIIRVFFLVSPLGHFGHENVQMPVPVYVAQLEAVAVGHFGEQLTILPVRLILWVSLALIPADGPTPVPWRHHDLGVFRWFQTTSENEPPEVRELDSFELFATCVLEPGITGEDVHFSVGVHVKRRSTLDVRHSRWFGIGENRREGPPVLCGSGIERYLSEKKRGGLLVPKSELGLAGPQEIAKHLVVMLVLAPLLHDVPFPGDVLLEGRGRILPPPHLAALVVSAKQHIQVAVAVDIVCRASRFDSEVLILYGVRFPAAPVAPIPDQCRRFLAKTQDKVIYLVAVKVANQGASLLLGTAGRDRQVTLAARQMLPVDVSCKGGEKD